MTRWLALALLFVAVGCGGRPDAAPRPNVLLVYTDDQRFDSLSITGNGLIETPNLDRIAREGALFERAYVTTSRCCPGRASMLTGKYATAHGVWNNHPEHDFLDEHRSIADYLGDAGYETAWIGKWHLPNPGAMPVRGFEHWVSYEGPGSHFDQTFNVDGETVPSAGFQADRLTDYALEFLAAERDEPFFLVLALKNPHVPMTPAARHAGRLAGAAIEVPESASDPIQSLPAFYRRLRISDGRHAIEDVDAYQQDVRAYWELVLSIDDNVGRVLDALEASGALDETLVIATTDNGQLLGEHGLQQKGLSYEPSIRVPLVMRYPPVIPAGTRVEELTLNVDLAPTVLDLAGVRLPDDMHGTSVVPLLVGTGAPWREHFAYLAPSFGDGGMVERALVGPRWKYVKYVAESRTEEFLYDRLSDPDERRNFASEQEQVLEGARRALAGELAALDG